jgi:hypothetical protein
MQFFRKSLLWICTHFFLTIPIWILPSKCKETKHVKFLNFAKNLKLTKAGISLKNSLDKYVNCF